MQHKRIQKWIEWEAKKYDLKVIYVNPAYSSTTCPKCGEKVKENGYRTLRCENCGFEEHRDYVAVYNLCGRRFSAPLDCSQSEGWKKPLRP